MGKRRASLLDLLLILPAWVSVVIAGVTYLALAFAAPAYSSRNPMTVGIANVAVRAAPYVASIFLFVGVLSFLRAWSLKRKFNHLDGIESVRGLPWRQFESIVGEAFRRRGYAVIENAVDGPDGGIDLVLRKGSEKFVVQCKQWRQWKVGVKPIREFYGVMTAGGATGGFFVASGEYTLDAREFARKVAIKLIDGPELVEMIKLAREPEPFLKPTAGRREPTVDPSPAETPECPNCGRAMVLRRATKGANAGERFWGCPSFPKCRGTRAA